MLRVLAVPQAMERIPRATDTPLSKEGTIPVVVEETVILTLQAHRQTTAENTQQNSHAAALHQEEIGQPTVEHMLQADESKAQGEGDHDVTDGHTAPEPLGVVVRIGLGPRCRFFAVFQFDTQEGSSATVNDHVKGCHKQAEEASVQEPGLNPVQRGFRT